MNDIFGICMRRFIDVVFIHPKNRYYVVLHQGKFWQLARMSLTASSWVFKLLYKGNISDIFVARNQAVVDEKLSKILKTYELPTELHGQNAQRFLDWWDMNDYKWLSTKDVITLDNLPVITPKPIEPPKTIIMPGALAILQKKQLSDLPKEKEPEQTKNPEPNLPTEQVIATPTTPKPEPTPQTQTIQVGKTTINESLLNETLLGKFNISAPADFAPDSVVTNPIPNPPPKTQIIKENIEPMLQSTTQEPRRPVSKLAEFNAQYAKKSDMPSPMPTNTPNQSLLSNIQTTQTSLPSTGNAGSMSSRSTTPITSSSTATPKAAEPKKRESMLDESFDIFDSLLQELNNELIS